jgi:hypothetical protein
MKTLTLFSLSHFDCAIKDPPLECLGEGNAGYVFEVRARKAELVEA